MGQAGVCDEIWAYGLRNPWRFSFDSLTGDLYTGDVGQNAWEEIDFAPASSTGGENYGWRCYEGNHAYNTSGCSTNPNDYLWPIYEYSHPSGAPRAVTGGFVYRGTQHPIMQGYYLFGEYITDQMWALISDGSGGWINQSLPNFPASPSTFGVDVYGEIYGATLGTGRIYLIEENTPVTAQLSIHKSAASAVPPGAPITYTLTVTNSGDLAATNLLISDDLPANSYYVSGGSLVGNTVSWAVSDLSPDSATSVTFVVTATQTITNEVYGVTADGGINVVGEEPVVTTILTPDLHIHKTGPESAVAGTPITYTLTVANQGGAAATNLVISDTLPVGANYLPGSGGSLNGEVVVWNLASLPGGETADFQFAVTTTHTITNLHYVVTADGGYGAVGNEPVVTIIQSPDLHIHKTAPESAVVGTPFTYTLTVANQGGVAATNLVISDTLPAGATYLAGSGGMLNGNVVVWNLASLPGGETADFQFAVTATQTVVNEIYQVTADGGFGAVGSEPVTTVALSPLGIHKTAPALADANTPITYTLTISNSGGITLTNLFISDTLPVGATFISSPDGGSFDGQDVTWQISSLAAGSQLSVHFVVTATETIRNITYQVTADGGWSAVGNTQVVTLVDALSTYLPIIFKP